MYLLDVIPAVKLPMADMQLLTYFSKEALPVGALVRVPIGRRAINALVVGSTAMGGQKISIKNPLSDEGYHGRYHRGTGAEPRPARTS